MTTRKLTIELTEAEYGALASAVALAEADDETRGVKTLLRAWNKINSAWHNKARRTES